MTDEAVTDFLRVDALTKVFGGVRAVDTVSFDIARGEIVGIIGPNGAGKTTLFNMISGFIRQTEGSVRWKDRDVSHLAPATRASIGLVRTFQNSRVFPMLSVAENVRIGMYRFSRQHNALASMATRRGRERAREVDERIAAILAKFRFTSIGDTAAGTLSYGQAKRLGLAIALASEPEMLLLDEPAAGLNHGEIDILRQDIEELLSGGVTVALVEHHMSLVMAICKRVLVIDAGKKIADDAPGVVVQDPRVIEAYLGS